MKSLTSQKHLCDSFVIFLASSSEKPHFALYFLSGHHHLPSGDHEKNPSPTALIGLNCHFPAWAQALRTYRNETTKNTQSKPRITPPQSSMVLLPYFLATKSNQAINSSTVRESLTRKKWEAPSLLTTRHGGHNRFRISFTFSRCSPYVFLDGLFVFHVNPSTRECLF